VVLTSELYFLVYNLQNLTNEQDIKTMKKLMNDKAFLENYLSFNILNVAPYFRFDWNTRVKYNKLPNVEDTHEMKEPYE
jgi:hypothetical protein